MLVCPVCKIVNDEFSICCKNCGSYLQNKVTNLDFFPVSMKLIISPAKTFKIITLSEHKNFSVCLYVLLGIYLNIMNASLLKLGSNFNSIFGLATYTLLGGMIFGLLFSFVITIMHMFIIKALSGKSNFRISLGITSYSFLPFVISLFATFPVKLLTFGEFMFTFNPSPLVLKPISFIVITILELLILIWSIILLAIGTHVGNQLSLIKSIIVTCIIMVMILSMSYWVNKIIFKYAIDLLKI